MPDLPPDRRRAHVERMLARAERRSHQAAKLVDKWKSRLVELDRPESPPGKRSCGPTNTLEHSSSPLYRNTQR
jgi:hypothetical protein